MKQVCLTLAFIAILNNVGRAAASDPKILPSVFARANSSYESGDFASAEKLYRQILDAGVENGAVFYNLGNTCFKQKKIGAAIPSPFRFGGSGFRPGSSPSIRRVGFCWDSSLPQTC